jgi:hypothetical protein
LNHDVGKAAVGTVEERRVLVTLKSCIFPLKSPDVGEPPKPPIIMACVGLLELGLQLLLLSD